MVKSFRKTPDYDKVLDNLPPEPEPKLYTSEELARRAEVVPVLSVDFSDLPHAGSMILEDPEQLLFDVRNGNIGEFLETIWPDALEYEGYTISIKVALMTRGELDDMGEWTP